MKSIQTLYGDVPKSIFDACQHLKLLVLDVDGVLSDGSIYLGNSGEEFKAFNSKDGYGIKAMSQCGIDVAVITGRSSHIVQSRMQALNARYIIQGTENKFQALHDLMLKAGLTQSQVASIGDDMPDIGLFKLSQIKVATHDSHPYVKKHANFITTLNGGRGAVREFCDLVLQAKGLLDMTHGASL